MDNITGALEAAEKARKLRPDWDEPYAHLGNIYRERGIRHTAMAMYDSALRRRAELRWERGRAESPSRRCHMAAAPA